VSKDTAIVVVGGYNSVWPVYLPMARYLEDLARLPAVGVPLMPWDWWTMERAANPTNILQKLVDTVNWARRRFQAQRFILIGHSAGGLIARLYLSTSPVYGRLYDGLECVTQLITLGTPHCSHNETQNGWFLITETNQLAPVSVRSPYTSYLAVASRYVEGRLEGTWSERRAYRSYRFFTGQGDVSGDGVVPLECADLPGVPSLVLDGVAHSRKSGSPWYGGSKAIIRRWWPSGDPRGS
jgi:pimeloyl-ACP methyl ester carboxylesterase